MQVSTAAQFKALGHPFRQRLMFRLGLQPATISQLAVALDAQKGNVAHHVKVLREAGMVRVVETRRVRGGTEQYYQRSARRLDIAGWHTGPATAMLGAVAEELATAADDPLLSVRHLRLGPAQAARLAEALDEIVDGAEDEGPDHPRYGLLVTLYRGTDAQPDA